MLLQWFYVDNPPGSEERPKWMRSAAIAEDGTVFIPSSVGHPDEGKIFSLACWDCVPVVRGGMHLYFPSGWMAATFPDMADICRLIERRIKDEVAMRN